MTENTQAELDSIDEILNTYQIESILISKGITGPSDVTVKARQAIIDWHNMQTEAVLGRLEKSIDGLDTQHTVKFGSVLRWSDVSEAIQSERNKLKEGSNGN